MFLCQFDSPIKTICAAATHPNSKGGCHMISQILSEFSSFATPLQYPESAESDRYSNFVYLSQGLPLDMLPVDVSLHRTHRPHGPRPIPSRDQM